MSNLPPEIEIVRQRVMRTIAPLRPYSGDIKELKYAGHRTDASRTLPPYYLVYFLLVDLLGFHNLGKWEKVAWEIPVDFNGISFIVSHRKFGLGLFANDESAKDVVAQEQVVALIKRAVKLAKPYFSWFAEQAVRASDINVINNGATLLDRFEYLRGQYQSLADEAEARKGEEKITVRESNLGKSTTYEFPHLEIRRNANWMAMAAIDAFFSWTEHIFIHIAILLGRSLTGTDVADLAAADWGEKYKAAVGIADAPAKKHFDALVILRRQLRNFMAHGAFGKSGEAFEFHSPAGAVPVAFEIRNKRQRFSLSPELRFNNAEAMQALQDFIAFLWSGEREPAKLYIQESSLPLILPLVRDGTYAKAMSSVANMKAFTSRLGAQFDAAANMDW